MTITVLICTRNRALSLSATLESLFSESNMAEPGWDAIVVDNGSTDGTRELCRDFERRHQGHFRYILENTVGKSNALNTGLRAATGELIAMTDDDVTCAPDYIRGIQQTFREHPADAAQGRTLISCEGGRPSYLHNDLAMFMGLRDFGDVCRELTGNLCGTNSVVRATVFKVVGGYEVELGAGAIGYAEDTEMSQRIRSAGFRMIYAPDILVTHQLPRRRLSRAAFRKRYFGLGRSNAFRVPMHVPLWRFGLYVLKEALQKEPVAWWLRLSGRPAQSLRLQCEVRELAGFFLQHCRLRNFQSRPLSADYRAESCPPGDASRRL